MAKYDYTISHVPEKLLYTADTLSRDSLQEEVETFVNSITKLSLPATEQRLDNYRQSQPQDPVCSQVREFCKTEWPNKQRVPQELMPYWKMKDSLTICDNLLLYNSRIVVPKSMQKETLQKIHAGHHLGIEKCKKRTSSSVWWPGVMQQIVQVVQNCEVCAKEAKPGKEPLISTQLPKYPWQVVGTDLFELNKNNYLLVVDYFSRYPEVTSTTSVSIISVLKSIFASHGIPEIVRSDNGPQYSSAEFVTHKFLRISAHHQQSQVSSK